MEFSFHRTLLHHFNKSGHFVSLSCIGIPVCTYAISWVCHHQTLSADPALSSAYM